MRTLALMLLLASTAAPAMAQRGDRTLEDRAQARSERAERAERPSRAERTEARSEARESRAAMRAQRMERQSAPAAQETQSVQQAAPVAQDSDRVQRRAFQGRRERVRNQQVNEKSEVETTTQASDGIVPRRRAIRTIPDTSLTTPVVTQNNDGTVTTQHRSRDGGRWTDSNHRRWDRDGWRSSSRYNWRRYRDSHRSLFRLGLYVDPFGWGYNRWGIGSYLYPSYYSSSFWLNDPWMYRLPPAYGSYRWVRYHDDALLIDTWTGEVVDVIYNFFW